VPCLRLYFLGPPRIERDGQPISVDTRKAIALLAYVAITGECHRRDSLVNLLWPESDRSRGRAALRRTLYALRKALAGDWLDVDRETIGLDPSAGIWLDVAQFHHQLDQCHSHGHSAVEICPACLAPLTAAVALYRDDFLSGFSLKDSFNFDDWQFFQTDALRRELGGALERLVHCHSAEGALEPAIGCAQRWLALDRLDESAHRELMQLYAWSGQRSAALRQYQECVKILQDQLGVSPQESTAELYSAIKAGRPPRLPAGLGVPRREERKENETPVPLDTHPTLPREEKRIVTVMCADMSGSFQSLGKTSPEDESALIRRFVTVMQDCLAKYGGQVDRILGERILGVFGVTQTHESDPELALRAAIEIRGEAEKIGLSLAAGINSGEVHFSSSDLAGHREFALMGTVVDLAARLAGKATVGQILVGESTYRLARRAFEFTPLSLDIKGMDRPITAYRAERLLPRPRKARGIEGLGAELIGRDKELAALKEILAQVRRGQGQMVSLMGEAGVGKSRLVAELKGYARSVDDGEPPPLWLEGRCLELEIAPSYAPFIDIFRMYFAWRARDDDDTRRERILSSLLDTVGQGEMGESRSNEMGPLLGRLLSVRLGDEWEEALRDSSPEQIRHQTFLIIRDFFVALSRQRPVVLVFEDLHWADDLSLDLISLLMEALPVGPLLLLCIYRPERQHKCWHLGTVASQKCGGHYTELYLRELTPHQSRRLVESLLTIEDLPSPVKDLILNRSQGNPFFIEEVLRSLIEAGVVYQQGDVWHAREEVDLAVVPESVQSVILSRVDHLDDGLRHALQIASVVGRLFPRRVLAHAAQQGTELAGILWELEDRALIYQERAIPEQEYSFKHVLTQEAVYRNIPRHRRAHLHGKVAEAIEALFEASLDEHCEQLAHHYDKSGNWQKAVQYLLRAGEKAKRSYANEAAIAHLTKGLELIKSLPETPESPQQELELLVALGTPLVVTKGHAAPEVGTTYARARELCQKASDTPQLFLVTLGLRRYYLHRGELQTAHDLGEQLLALAQSIQDPNHLSRAHMMHGETLHCLGEFAQAREHLERGISFYDTHQRRFHTFLYGNDTAVGCWMIETLTLWTLGYPDQALKMADKMLALARELSHPFTLVCALYFAAALHQLRREARVVHELVETLLQISRERGFALYLAWGTVLRGWALAEMGQEKEGIDQIGEGIAARQSTMWLPNACAFLARAYGKTGEIEEGLKVLTEGLAWVDSTGERPWEAELHRLRGELLLRQSGGEVKTATCLRKAETCFEHAIDIAHRQNAKGWELRAATSLSRLWQGQGKEGPARELLRGAYGWFTEGLDTADLREAKALLDSLT
jgi:predicted ATPase/DNA-binding SARP family transcriptional activator